MKKLLINILIIVILLVALILAYFFLPFFKTKTAEIEAFTRILTIFVSFIFIAQLLVSLHQFDKAQKQEQDRRNLEFKARMEAFLLEISVNEIVCKEILQTKNSRGDDHTIPESLFHTDLLKNSLTDGFITNKEIILNLWNMFRCCGACNRMLEQAKLVLNYEHLTDPMIMSLANGRKIKTNRLMNEVYKYTENVASQIEIIKKFLVDTISETN